MRDFALKDINDLSYLLAEGAQSRQIWQNEIKKFTCGIHGSSAAFVIREKVNEVTGKMEPNGAITACCQEFADFCLVKLKEIIDENRESPD